MAKTMSSVFSEIFVNNLFELDSYACKCEKDTQNVIPGEPPETTLKLYSQEDHPIHFSYSDKDGLNLTGSQGRVLLKNVLGQVLALKEDDADGYIQLISKIGFILPVSSQNYEAVDLKALTEIIKRIKATIRLMNAIDGKTIVVLNVVVLRECSVGDWKNRHKKRGWLTIHVLHHTSKQTAMKAAGGCRGRVPRTPRGK